MITTSKLRHKFYWMDNTIAPPARKGRRCKKCDCMLSMYNTDKLCQPCRLGIIESGGNPDKWKGGE